MTGPVTGGSSSFAKACKAPSVFFDAMSRSYLNQRMELCAPKLGTAGVRGSFEV